MKTFQCALAVSALLAAMPVVASGEGQADSGMLAGFGQGALVWAPVAPAESWVLSVSGPGTYLRHRFANGEAPSLAAIAPDGLPLPDGRYNWELRALSAVVRVEEADEVGPASNPHTEDGEIFARRSQRPPPRVMAGTFSVDGGALVAPHVEVDTDEGVDR